MTWDSWGDFTMIAVKIECGCGQRYAFDVEPVGQVMAWPVYCPVCGADGTTAANQVIADSLSRPLPEKLRFQTCATNSHSTTLTRSRGKGMGRPASITRKHRYINTKWVGGLVGGSTALLSVLALSAYLQHYRVHKADHASVSPVARDNFPRTLRQLNAWYVEPPAGQNAATIYLQAFEALQTGNGALLRKG